MQGRALPPPGGTEVNESLLRRAIGSSLRPLEPAGLGDAVIAVAVAVVGAIGTLAAKHPSGHPLATAAIVTAMGLILYPRRRFPGAVLAFVALFIAGLAVLGASPEGGFIPILISSYSAAVYGSRRLAFGLATVGAAVLLAFAITTALEVTSLRTFALVRILLAASGAWLVGLVIRGQFSARTVRLEVMRERAESAAARQQEEARRATLAERLRIARSGSRAEARCAPCA
jgi:signal transduction histidine kinase